MYKSLRMSQGVYFVTKGIAEAYSKVTNESGGGEQEEKVKGIVSAGKLFGYSRFLASFLEEDMAVKAFTQLYVSRHVKCFLNLANTRFLSRLRPVCESRKRTIPAIISTFLNHRYPH